jgi:hypothetical protein
MGKTEKEITLEVIPWKYTLEEYAVLERQRRTARLRSALNDPLYEASREFIQQRLKIFSLSKELLTNEIRRTHFIAVKKAIERGENVPEEVRRQYPELSA